MASPVEFRHYLRKFTVDDARNGLQPIKQIVGPAVNGVAPIDIFAPPVLQFRYKEKVVVNGQVSLEWSDWADVAIVREGEESPPASLPSAAAAT